MKFIKRIVLVFVALVLVGFVLVYRNVFVVKSERTEPLSFTIAEGESIASVASRLQAEGVVHDGELLRRYIVWKKLDRSITHGTLEFTKPLTTAEVAELLASGKAASERTITIIPGSTIRDIATQFEKEGIATEDEVYALLGKPATYQKPEYAIDSAKLLFQGKPDNVSLEGYLAPETFRVFASSTLPQIITTFITHRAEQIDALSTQIAASGRSVYEILTIASMLEKEVRGTEAKQQAADLFWRRLDHGWALEADSTVHYVIGGNDSVFTSAKDRERDSLWNTYKYPGLPAGPISNPSLESIEAALNPTKNDYWFFLTTLDTGEAIFSRTIGEHTMNVQKYLR